ncbi:DUF3077 domain-containing protein [Pseudomonas kermanshahensis]|uniref:DUF3077 domain-containing protein n=1 Tax=Pseudomonas kermanshahensis TaxID=2745482 RepID=A0ABU8R3B9_9PSED|nr:MULTISPECIES: DUF3077 domain-containing protein [Pseudomonas]MBC3488386.1 DUF3077 domain-containing protein [Pseudomonas sp. SWRI50]MBC3497126.1 DUF3077 domain-containing protein [Pseudomonas sp. SWRI67]MBV4527415.1 DUF3077 domain-containing protein [Pseudomonas kermanshahensis]
MTTGANKAPTTVGKTKFYQGEKKTQPLFCIEPGIPCQDAREQASELMGVVRDLTIAGVMDDNPQLIWASHYLSALAKALMDDAELGMTR